MKVKFIIVFCLFVQLCFGQLKQVNNEVKAELVVDVNADLIEISSFAENLTNVYKSLYYKLMLFNTDDRNNKNNTSQSGRFTLESEEKKLVSKNQVNNTGLNKITIVLLIYDEEQQIIGSANFTYPPIKKNEIVKKAQNDGVEITGIISDETRTKFGKDFYDYFSTEFRKLKIVNSKIITIEEEMANRNTRIRVKVDYEIINEFITKPDDEFLKAMAEDSTNKVANYFKKIEKQNNDIIKY